MTATAAAAPTTAADVRDLVRECAAERAGLRIVGRGHWLDAGRPVRATRSLALDGLTGIIEYTPGDLTLTARAGTTLGEIARVTGAERQWLALDPFGASSGSLGATVATASAGPLAHTFGTPRDAVLGVEAVTGTGALVRAGGRVVKNVAGFDLTRLFTGAWGTLAVLTEVTVRLRALPDCVESYAVAAPETAEALAALLHSTREASVAPISLELVNGALARRLGLEPRAWLLVRLAGNAQSVRAQSDLVRGLGDAVPIPASTWSALREVEPDSASVVRLSRASSSFAACWVATREALGGAADALLHGSPGRGIVRCVLPAGSAGSRDERLERLMRVDAVRIAERLPAEWWGREVVASAVGDRLSRGVKQSFDPSNILNPGLLGEAS
jgi:glycolate oxidase FAD binding subunit